MNSKKVISIIVILVGVAFLFFSNYITKEVAAGRIKIEQGQKKIDTVDSIFSTNKFTKPIGKEITGSGQRKIAEGKMTIKRYESISNQLHLAGIVLIVVGFGLFLFWKKKK